MMQTDRRRFIRNLAGVALASAPLSGLAGEAFRGRLIGHRGKGKSEGAPDSWPTSWPASWDDVREEFLLDPAKSYLNNGAIGASPKCVIEAVSRYTLENERAPEHDELTEPRKKLAEFVGALPEELALTHNTTEAINVAVWGLDLKRGDEVILTTHEHAGGAIPWLQRARLDGIVLKTFAPASTAEEVLAQIASMINDRTRVIAVPHVSCTTGQRFPLEQITRLARERGLWTVIDGAHGTGMLPLAFRDSGVDFYASCGHKWLCGPKGTGYLYVRKERLEELRPLFVGASTDIGWDLSVTPPVLKGFVPSAHRFDYGTRSQALSAGLEAAVDFHRRIGVEKIQARGRELADQLLALLQERSKSVEILSPLEERSRSMMVGFRLKGRSTEDFWKASKAQGIRVRWIGEAGLDSIRVSTHLYNSPRDVERVVELIDQTRR